MKHGIALFCLLFCLFGSTSAHADAALARKAFESGAQAYREGRYKDAVQFFLQAYEEDRKPPLIYNAAQAYEKAGDVPNALRSYRRYLRLAPDADDRPTVELRVKNLEERLRDQGVQQVTVFSTPEGADVQLDGKSSGKTPWSAEIAPGRHVLVLRYDGLPDVTKEFVLTPDRSLELDIALGKSSATPAKTAESTTTLRAGGEARRDPSSRPQVGPLTWAAFGVGALGLGAGLGFELLRASAEEDARDSSTQLEHRDHYDTMKSRQTTARVATVVGAVGVTAGSVLLYLDLSRKPERLRQSTRLGVGCGAGDCAVFARGSF